MDSRAVDEHAVFKRLSEQITRVVATNSVIFNDDFGIQPIRDDIARSQVVFLFAAMEEVIREYAMLNFHNWKRDRLKEVALAKSDRHRADKFTVADLLDYRGHTIDDVISTSVYKHLNACSFTSAVDVVASLTAFGLSAPSSEILSALGSIIKRRHQIVHHNDFDPNDRTLERTAITRAELDGWAHATNEFLFSCIESFHEANYEMAVNTPPTGQ